MARRSTTSEGEIAPSSAGSQTVDRALGLLQLVAAVGGEGMRLADLAKAGGLDRATTYRLLASLTGRGFLDQDSSTKRYRLGLEVFALASAASNQLDLAHVARDSLRRLAVETGDTATFCVRSGLNLVCVDVETGDFPIKTLPLDIGSHRPMGAGASGVAMLAALPDFEMEAALAKCASRLEALPNQSVTAIRAAVLDCRARGYALTPDEPMGRIMGLAMALNNRRGRPQSTVTLNAIPERLCGERLRDLVHLLAVATTRIGDAMSRMPEKARHRSRWRDFDAKEVDLGQSTGVQEETRD